MTIPAALGAACSRYQSRVAFRMKQGEQFRTLTYRDLWQQATDFGAGLICLGLQKGDRVAIVCENGFEWVIGYLGQSMAGGVGVPLYVELKRREIEETVRWAEARFLIASARVLSRLRNHFPDAVKVICVGDDLRAQERVDADSLRRSHPGTIPFYEVLDAATEESRRMLAATRVEPDDLASIVFTSGTTGGMKGVMLTHRNFMSVVRSGLTVMPVSKEDRLLLVLPLHHAFPFAFAVPGMPLIGGETTFENDLLRIPERLADAKPTALLGVPALFELMYRAIEGRAETEGRKKQLDAALRIAKRVKDCTGINIGNYVFRQVHRRMGGKLRVLICGGAPMNPDLALKYFRLGIPLLQGWGLTEASPTVAMQRLSPFKFRFTKYYEKQVGTVGTAIPDVEVKLIDVPEKGIYVHLDGEGELVIRGPNVFSGYWKSPAKTSDAWVGEWFRTGDLGRIDKEGNIWITGRVKYVIVLESGEKVVPEELEGRLLESPLIDDICVVPRRVHKKTVLGAIICPNFDYVIERCRAETLPLSESSVRRLVESELKRFAAGMAPFKRISDVMLTNVSLPKTLTLNVARGHIKDSYSFTVMPRQWGTESALGTASAVLEQAPQELENT